MKPPLNASMQIDHPSVQRDVTDKVEQLSFIKSRNKRMLKNDRNLREKDLIFKKNYFFKKRRGFYFLFPCWQIGYWKEQASFLFLCAEEIMSWKFFVANPLVLMSFRKVPRVILWFLMVIVVTLRRISNPTVFFERLVWLSFSFHFRC